jgi:hypothetical protein
LFHCVGFGIDSDGVVFDFRICRYLPTTDMWVNDEKHNESSINLTT